MPATLCALAALVLAAFNAFEKRRKRLVIPLCWIVGVVLPFSLTHGFRPDYLLAGARHERPPHVMIYVNCILDLLS